METDAPKSEDSIAGASGKSGSGLAVLAEVDRELSKIEARLDAKAEELEGWPAPGPLPAELSSVPNMIPEMLPVGLRPWVSDIAERMSCPLEFPAVAAIVALASAIGRRVQIRPKRADYWTVVPNLWGAAVGRPGILKSPAQAEPLHPLQTLEAEAAGENARTIEEWKYEKIVRKVRNEEAERKIKDAIRRKQPIPKREAEAEQDAPRLVRYVVNDTTVEKLQEILAMNPNGVLHFRDELSGWLRTLDREGHQNDRAFFLESSDGNGSYVSDRIIRGTTRIEHVCLSILGSIQPGPLARYLRDAVKGGQGDDGLMQRFQLLVYPDTVAWSNVDRKPNLAAREQAERLFRSLAVDRETPLVLRFHVQAQDFFDEWRNDLEGRLRRDDEHPAMAAHLSKYRSLMPSLALVFHLADSGGVVESPVPLESARMAAAWCDFLEAHARRVYGSVVHGNRHVAHLLAAKLKAKDGSGLSDPFTARDIYRKAWSGLAEKEEVWKALDLLEDCEWVRCEKIESSDVGGKPTRVYHVNPRIRATA